MKSVEHEYSTNNEPHRGNPLQSPNSNDKEQKLENNILAESFKLQSLDIDKIRIREDELKNLSHNKVKLS